MKNIGILILIAGILHLPAYSQTQRPIQAKVIYRFTHIKDTTRPDVVYKEDMMLFFSTEESKYQSYSIHVSDSINEANMAKNGRIIAGKGTREQIFHNYPKGEQSSIIPWLGDTLLIKNSIEKINWQISDSAKNIGGFNCVKAEAFFRGHQYTAWFCPEIAVPAGPWKLQGLPGLILEAYDNKQTISFSFASFTNVTGMNYIAMPGNIKKITSNDFAKMKESLLSNPSGYISSVINGSDASSGSGASSSLQLKGPENRAKTPKKVNNPLEPEQ